MIRKCVKKKMLYVTAFPPNHQSGGQVFSCNAIKDLSEKYRIDLVYFDFPGHQLEEKLPVQKVKKFYPDKRNCLRHPLYFPIFTKRFSAKTLGFIQRIASRYDVLFFDYSQVSIYAAYVRHSAKIIRVHDVMVQKYKRKNQFLLPWVRVSENAVLRCADKIMVPSEKDCMILKKEYGLDSEYTNEYITDYTVQEGINADGFIIFGRWGRKENLNGLIWFVKNVCPRLGNEITKKIAVMGADMSREVIEVYLKPFGIKYLGYTEDSYGEIAKHKAMIAPIFDGAGVKVKVLDAFTAGTPVIGTDIAFEGIPRIQGLVYQANQAEEFERMIKSIINKKMPEKNKLRKKFSSIYCGRRLSDFI